MIGIEHGPRRTDGFEISEASPWLGEMSDAFLVYLLVDATGSDWMFPTSFLAAMDFRKTRAH